MTSKGKLDLGQKYRLKHIDDISQLKPQMPSHQQKNQSFLGRLMQMLRLRYYQYTLITGQYVLRPEESALISMHSKQIYFSFWFMCVFL